jgi:hypothetical protein
MGPETNGQGPSGPHWQLLVGGGVFTKHITGLEQRWLLLCLNMAIFFFFYIGGHWRNLTNGQYFLDRRPLAAVGMLYVHPLQRKVMPHPTALQKEEPDTIQRQQSYKMGQGLAMQCNENNNPVPSADTAIHLSTLSVSNAMSLGMMRINVNI